MSLLKEISDDVQQVAEAISISIGVEVEIVDENLTVIGGTGIYKNKIGKKEELGALDGNTLYARVIRKGKTERIEDAQGDENYGISEALPEMAEICTPIRLGNKILGVIGLVAFENYQKEILMNKNKNLTLFIEKMAELLAAKATQQIAFRHVEISRNEIMTILESAHEGIIAIDRGGYIKHCNSIVADLFGSDKEEMKGTHLNQYMIGSPALNIFKTKKGYTEKEERYRVGRGGIHLIVTAKPIFAKGSVAGVVISLRDIKEAQLLAYKMGKGPMKKHLEDLIGASPAMEKVNNQAFMAARGDSAVLITGETGTGKEFLARAIHYNGTRTEENFVRISSKIPDEIIYDEILDKIQEAQFGTIYIKDIDKVSIKTQKSLLKTLFQNKDIIGVDIDKKHPRIIVSSSRDLKILINKNEFLPELYHRIATIPIYMPSLIERGEEDIWAYLNYYLKKYNTLNEGEITGFTEEAKTIYMSYAWPGNIEEMENALEHSVRICRRGKIRVEHIPQTIISNTKETTQLKMKLSEQIKLFEKEKIIEEIDACNGSKKEAAHNLGISTATFYRKLEELDIEKKWKNSTNE